MKEIIRPLVCRVYHRVFARFYRVMDELKSVIADQGAEIAGLAAERTTLQAEAVELRTTIGQIEYDFAVSGARLQSAIHALQINTGVTLDPPTGDTLDYLAAEDSAVATISSFSTQNPRLYLSARPDWLQFAKSIKRKTQFPISFESPAEILIHFGIERNGNNTQRDALLNIVSPQNTFSFNIYKDAKQKFAAFQEKTEDERNNIKIAHIHALCPIHKVLEQKTTYATFLRDPLRAFLSLQMDRSEKLRKLSRSGWTAPNKARMNKLLEPIIAEEETTTNGRHLLTAKWLLSFELGPCDSIGEWPPNTSRFESSTDDELFQRVTAVLDENFGFVGITERLSESLVVLSSIYGMDKVPLWQLRHVSGAPGPNWIAPELVDRIRHLLRIDFQIYERQCALFEQQYGGLLDGFDQIVGELTFDNMDRLRDVLVQNSQ